MAEKMVPVVLLVDTPIVDGKQMTEKKNETVQVSVRNAASMVKHGFAKEGAK